VWTTQINRYIGRLTIVKATGLRQSNPYAVVQVSSNKPGSTVAFRTAVIKNSVSPEWHETFRFNVEDVRTSAATVTIYDHDLLSAHSTARFVGCTRACCASR